MRRQAAPEKRGSSNAWMATFSDLLMLMLTFFVLLLTMSSLDAKKVRELARSGVHQQPSSNKDSAIEFQDKAAPPLIAGMTKALGKLNGGDDDVKEQVKTLMKELLKVSGIAGEAWIEVRATGVQVTIAGDIAFDEGSAQLTKEARQFVEDYARVAQGAGSNVSVETYLATQGSFEEEDAGWELALKRADTVASTIGRSGVEGQFIRVSARGARLGADELKFVQAAEVLRLGLIVGEPGAEASVGTKQ